MVLLARRSVQDVSDDKNSEGGCGEGIEVGSRVCVLSRRHFQQFSAGDVGEVKHVDHDAMNCNVVFDGRDHSVTVALRHLKLMHEESGTPSSMINTSTSPRQIGPSALVARVDACGNLDNDDREDVAVIARENLLKSTRPNSNYSSGSTVVDSGTYSESMASSSPRASSSVGTLQTRSPAGFERYTGNSPSAAAWKENHLGSLSLSEPPCTQHVDDDDDGGRIEALEARLGMLEASHRTEIASLQCLLEDALVFGRQQEARASSLEQHVRLQEGCMMPCVGLTGVPPAVRQIQGPSTDPFGLNTRLPVQPLPQVSPPSPTVSPQMRSVSIPHSKLQQAVSAVPPISRCLPSQSCVTHPSTAENRSTTPTPRANIYSTKQVYAAPPIPVEAVPVEVGQTSRSRPPSGRQQLPRISSVLPRQAFPAGGPSPRSAGSVSVPVSVSKVTTTPSRTQSPVPNFSREGAHEMPPNTTSPRLCPVGLLSPVPGHSWGSSPLMQQPSRGSIRGLRGLALSTQQL